VTTPIFRRTMGSTAAIAIATALSACGQPANDSQMTAATTLPELPATLPLDAGGSIAWPTAPEVAALPNAAPLRTVRVADQRDYYGYADAAYDYQEVLGDAPPDYYFDYDGVDPWAWEGYDQSVVFLEPIDDGYRYYYYRPGADTPYFVRDPYYGYGYDGDGLAVVYDRSGAVIPYNDYGASRDYAARYLVRGRDLYAASRRGDRRGVSAAAWAARQPTIFAARSQWAAVRERQPQWRQFHARAAPRQATYWREEAARRQADTQRFDQWRAQSFRTPPPPRAIPAAWSNARWARDEKRFQPARAERAAAVAAAPQVQADNGRRDRAGIPDRGTPPNIAAAPDPRRLAIDGQRGRGARVTGPTRVPQGRAATPQPGDARAIQPRADRQPDRGSARPVVAARPERPNPGNAPRIQPQRPQRMERPQPLARVDRPRPQPQPRTDGGNRPQFRAPRAEAPRPQPQPQARAPQPSAPAAPAQPRGNGGGNGGDGNGGGGGKGGGGKHGGRG
jgi:uncharacterized membrane protein YgcG